MNGHLFLAVATEEERGLHLRMVLNNRTQGGRVHARALIHVCAHTGGNLSLREFGRVQKFLHVRADGRTPGYYGSRSRDVHSNAGDLILFSVRTAGAKRWTVHMRHLMDELIVCAQPFALLTRAAETAPHTVQVRLRARACSRS